MQFLPLLVMFELFGVILVDLESKVLQLSSSVEVTFRAAYRIGLVIVQQIRTLFLDVNFVFDFFSAVDCWRLTQTVSFAFHHRGSCLAQIVD